MTPMAALMFLGRWLWVAVIAVILVMGAYMFRTINEFDDSARLASDVGALRGYQEQLLQARLAAVTPGGPDGRSIARILEEAEARAESLIEAVDPDRHNCDGTCLPGAIEPTHAHTISIAIEAVIEDLHRLAALTAFSGAQDRSSPSGWSASFSQQSSAWIAAGGDVEVDAASSLAAALEYSSISASLTRHLNEATDALAEDGVLAADRVRRVGRVGIVTLLVGGLISTSGLAWSGRRARRLSWDIERAREMNALKSEFVGLASHELRTPLAGIYGFSELLLSDQALSTQSRGWAEHIHDESHRLATIVDSLLSITRIEAGEIEVVIESVDVGPLVEAIADFFAGVSTAHSITLEGDLEVAVLADRTILGQVLTNLVDNAVKYSPDGGDILLRGSIAAGDLRIAIIDHGIGIAPEDIDLIFDRFHRGTRPGTETIRSTGLGLYLVKQLLESMGGSVEVQSELDVGTTMTVVLPLDDLSTHVDSKLS